jgi:hypothetical protein
MRDLQRALAPALASVARASPQRDAYDVTEPRAASAGLADSLEATDEWLGTDDDVVAEALRFAPPRS